MGEEIPYFRGRVVPEDSGERNGITKEEAEANANEILGRRQRGRVLPGGTVVSKEEIYRRLEARAREGHLSSDEAGELRRLKFEQEGSKIDRAKPKPDKDGDKRKTKWP